MRGEGLGYEREKKKSAASEGKWVWVFEEVGVKKEENLFVF